MRSFQKVFLVAFLGVAFLTGCTGKQNLEEPPGKRVELTASDMDAASFSYADVKTWNAWEIKGNNLHNNGFYEEALYCYHQAMATWPEKLPDSAPEALKAHHFPEPT